MKSKPLVSIIMPVYNPGSYLSQAIDSILNQSFTNFELIIVDDASTDNSWKTIRSYAKKDKRIIAKRNRINLGVSLTSNIATSLARGKFLARTDSDDISAPNRLQKQLRFLQRHPQVIAVGSQVDIINDDNQLTATKSFPVSPKDIYNMIFWATPLQQGAMMVNLSKLPKNFAWYSASKTSAEEVNLFFEFLRYGHLANLPDTLYFYRQLPNSLSHQNPKRTFYLTLQSRLEAIQAGFTPSLLAILINLAQLVAILLLPQNLIYDLWYRLRGVKGYNLSNASLASHQTELG